MAETADHRSVDIRRNIDQTRASLDQKFDLLESKVRGVRTAIDEAVDIRHHAARHPWAFVGLSVAAGCAIGSLAAGATDRDNGSGPRPGGRVSRLRQAAGQHGRDVIDSVALAAGAAATDLLRQAIRQTMPAFAKHLDEVWTERGITAKTAARAVIGRPAAGPG
jgi:ElaB/YqjD/DUF883 family membrane-anchored ribosome-binding protein